MPCSKIFLMGKYLDRRDKSFDQAHQQAIKPRRFLIQYLFKPVLTIFKIVFNLKVIGRENVPNGNFLIAPAHYSILDPFIMAAAKKDLIPMRFVAKSQIFRFPFTRLFVSLGAFPIKRGSFDQDAFKTAKEILSQNRLVVFPQGGTHKEININQAKWGIGYLVNTTGGLVLPVYLKRGLIFKRKGVVNFGQPICFEKINNPTREDNLKTAKVILQAVINLKDSN